MVGSQRSSAFAGRLLACLTLASTALAQVELAPRPGDAPGGAELAKRLADAELAERERALVAEVLRGNVPASWRRFAEVEVTRELSGRRRELVFRVAPDYVTVGSDDDGFRIPLTPSAAQEIADALGCVLPTPAMVDAVHAAAAVRLTPEPMTPDGTMVTVAAFRRHDELVERQLAERRAAGLVAGHKKDVVLTPDVAGRPDRVAIYGWHRPDGEPIQPLYHGHSDEWVDYSHGVRLVERRVSLDGVATTVEAILADPDLAPLLSRAGPIERARYGPEPPAAERLVPVDLGPGLRAVAQVPEELDPDGPVHLVLYALSNGSTIEQTIGRPARSDEDWRATIQHVGAQARWLRTRALERDLVVVYLECAGLAWPRWLRENDPDGERAVAAFDAVRARFGAGAPARVVLTGHSGGGAFSFALLDAWDRIPDAVERIAFLDSNYRYDSKRGHDGKLLEWLQRVERGVLVVLAYQDDVALLDGKPFVSAEGGTWGRSRAMLADLSRSHPFETRTSDDLRRHTALGGRIRMLLRENPEREILHTVQVERNGFVHALLVNTGREEIGYRYLGPRVYDAWIAASEDR